MSHFDLRSRIRRVSRIANVGRRWVPLMALVAFCGIAFMGCGGDDGEDAGPCADKLCMYGVCDQETGECVNAQLCGDPGGDAGMMPAADAGDAQAQQSTTKKSECLRGYVCQDNNCVAEYECSEEAPCARGECEKGACVDVEPCSGRFDCLPGKGCSQAGVCKNLCEDKTCERGVCNPETGKCLNPQTCTPTSDDKELSDCIEGYKCADPDEDGTNTCQTEQQFCESLGCERGTCSFDRLRCVDKETCSEDVDCLSGNYCDKTINECKTNTCNEQMTTCDRGTCNPASGECVNPESCSASDECLPAHSCVEGRCVPEGDECGPNGCPGNQVCEYDSDLLTAECQEAPGGVCQNAVDCTGNSVCRGGTCTSPSPCSPDQFEPNNSSLTDFLDGAVDQTLEANLCGSSDVDRYAYDSEEAKGTVVRGTLLVDLVIEPTDVGQGTATLTLTDTSGNILAQQSTNKQGVVQLERKLGAGEFDTFQFKVSGSNINTAGLRYSLFAGIAPQTVTRACQQAEELNTNTNNKPPGPTPGNTNRATSLDVDATCSADGTEEPEKIYNFNLAEEHYVNLRLTPREGADLTLSLRRRCASLGSELRCSNLGGQNETEAVGRRLTPGTYSVIVQGDQRGDGGPFSLSFSKEKVICSAGDNQCVSDNSAKVCRDNGTTFNEIACDSGASCNTNTGRCPEPAGDNCYEVIDVGGSATGLEPDWAILEDDFSPRTGCVTDEDPIGGPDAVYKVTVGAGETLEANFDVGQSNASGALYLQYNCADTQGTCIGASSSEGPQEQLVYENESGAPETLYLVADTSSDVNSGTGSVDIKTGVPICQPGAKTCDGSDLKTCTDSGLGYDVAQCQFGCNNGECNPPPFDTCSGAVDLTNGGSSTASYAELQGDYNPPSSCAGDGAPSGDAVYKVDLASDDVVTAEVTADSNDTDPMVYLVSSCGSPTQVNSSCLAGTDDGFNGDTETLRFSPSTTFSGKRTYYIIVDNDGTGASGSYTITTNIQKQVCTPGSVQCGSSSSTIEVCNSVGISYNQYQCQGSNTTCQSGSGSQPATCPEPTADNCADPIDVDKNGSVTNSDPSSDQISVPFDGTQNCSFAGSTPGHEHIYRIDLEKDDYLQAELNSSESEATLYILDTCVSISSCVASTGVESANQTLDYLAKENETITLVVDNGSFFGGGLDSPYTLDLTTTPNTTCVPNDLSCTGPNTLSECNAVGSGFSNQFNCSNGCSGGSCNPPVGSPPPQDSCGTAPNVGNGTFIKDAFSGYSNTINLPASACGINTAGDGVESIYAVDVVPGEIVEAEMVNRDSFVSQNPVLYILDSCSNPANSCVAGASGGDSASISYTATSNTTLYIVADNDYTFGNFESFELKIEKKTPNCSPGSKYCTSNNQGVTYCTPQGLTQNYPCNGTCQSGSCQNPTGNRCVDPIELSEGSSFSGSFSDFDNNVNPGKSASCGLFRGGANGPDAVFEVNGYAQGETLVADLIDAPDSARMYTLSSCPFGTSDVSDECGTTQAGEGKLKYNLDGPSPVYLVVDSNDSNASGDFEVQLSKETGDICSPGQATCQTSSSVQVCNLYGDAVDRTFNCTTSCQSTGICKAPSSANDTCLQAHPIGDGTRIVDTYSRFTEKLNPGCANSNDDGQEAVYSLSVPANHYVEATVTDLNESEDFSVYFLDTCPPSGSACIGSADSVSSPFDGYGGPLTATYQNTTSQANTVYLVVDSDDFSTHGQFLLEVETGAEECTPGSGSTTCLGPETAGTCSSYGKYVADQTCYFGCPKSASGCTAPPNDQCSGAIEVSAGSTYFADIGEYTNDYNHEDRSSGVANCIEGGQANGATAGPDAIYKVQLNKYDQFNANLLTPGNSVQWVTDSCETTSQAMADACVAGENSGGGNERVEFVAPSTGTYYIVADVNTDVGNPNPDGEMELQVDEAGDAFCDQTTRQCKSGSSDKIQYCQKPGDQFSEKTCAGTCSGGACTQTTGDFCEDAVSVSDGTSISYSVSSYSDTYDVSSGTCLPNTPTAGGDKVFQVELAPGETLDFNPSTSAQDDIQIYVTENCGDNGTLQNSCVAAEDSSGAGSSETLSFSPSISIPTTYFVVVDTAGSASTTGTISGTFNITP